MTRLIFVVFTFRITTDLFFKFKVFLENTCLSGAKNLNLKYTSASWFEGSPVRSLQERMV